MDSLVTISPSSKCASVGIVKCWRRTSHCWSILEYIIAIASLLLCSLYSWWNLDMHINSTYFYKKVACLVFTHFSTWISLKLKMWEFYILWLKLILETFERMKDIWNYLTNNVILNTARLKNYSCYMVLQHSYVWPKNILLLKNSQFLRNHYETWSKCVNVVWYSWFVHFYQVL